MIGVGPGFALAASLALQQAAPTVGDTVWLTRLIGAPAESEVRPADWDPADPVELLGPARVSRQGDSVRIAYPVVIWRAGEHRLEVPGPLLVGPGSVPDTLPPDPVRLRVASVLPDVPPDSILPPQPRADLVPRGTRSLVPVLVLPLGVGLLLLPLHLLWRRRGKPARPADEAPSPSPPPLERWADAGEQRAVAAAAAARLRRVVEARVPELAPGTPTADLLARVAGTRPEWPLEELGGVLRALEETRFGTASAEDALALARAAETIERRLAEAP